MKEIKEILKKAKMLVSDGGYYLSESELEQVARDAWDKSNNATNLPFPEFESFNDYWKQLTDDKRQFLDPEIDDEAFAPRKDGLRPSGI